MAIRTSIIALACLLGVSGCASISERPIAFPTQIESSEHQGILSDVGTLQISGQPSAEALKTFADAGGTTVISLRTQAEMDNREAVPFDEAALLEELDITYVHIPLGGADTPYTPEAVAQFAEAVESADGEVLLHCTVAWRASHMWAAYLVEHKGYTVEEAIRHADAINLNGYTQPGKQPIELFLGLTKKPAGLK